MATPINNKKNKEEIKLFKTPTIKPGYNLKKEKIQEAEDNMNYANNKMVALSKSRIKQLLQLKEEAVAKGDDDKIKIIDSELFLLRD